MGILNNIWMALSTPNEGLANFIVSPGGFIEAFLIMKLFLTLLEINTTKKQKLIYVFSMTIIRYFFNVFGS